MILQGKIALVTGGAVRVGRSISKSLSTAGATLFIHFHKSKKAAESLKREIEDKGRSIYLIQGDLTQMESVHTLIDQVISKGGGIHILINNAALFYKTPLGQVSEEEWDRLFTLNLKTAFFCAQYAGVHMKEHGGGKIINIGDPSGERPWSSYIPYGITKAGIISMTKGLARALAPDVQVNCINPGPVMLPEYYTEEERDRAIRRTLLKREGTAEDIASAVRFLLEGSDYITGSIINVDGGRSIV